MTEQTKERLIYIPVGDIDPHPDNPRRDLGDLTELADSIKANGILQNLTVVPWFDEESRAVKADSGRYRALIGHRRLAAAKKAGLERVPCVVAELTHQEQVRTMLQENMQRSDLTVYEQAQGFQMMLDLGDSVESLAKRSGFSQSTIRRRVKLLELDPEEFKRSESRGASLADYAELEKLESPRLKNRVLKYIGSVNFRNELKAALDKEKKEKQRQAWIDYLSPHATEVPGTSHYKTLKYSTISTKPETADILNGLEGKELFFNVASWGTVYLMEREEEAADGFAELEREQKRQAKEQKRQREEQRRAGLREAGARAYELREEFAGSVSGTTVRQHLADIMAAWVLKESTDSMYLQEADVAEIFGLEEDEDGHTAYRDVLEKVSRSPEVALWKMVYLCFGDGETQNYVSWKGTREDNWVLDRLYELLEKLGYAMSDEERALQDGTHELFNQEG